MPQSTILRLETPKRSEFLRKLSRNIAKREGAPLDGRPYPADVMFARPPAALLGRMLQNGILTIEAYPTATPLDVRLATGPTPGVTVTIDPRSDSASAPVPYTQPSNGALSQALYPAAAASYPVSATGTGVQGEALVQL